jgi:hypothetical protein
MPTLRERKRKVESTETDSNDDVKDQEREPEAILNKRTYRKQVLRTITTHVSAAHMMNITPDPI